MGLGPRRENLNIRNCTTPQQRTVTGRVCETKMNVSVERHRKAAQPLDEVMGLAKPFTWCVVPT